MESVQLLASIWNWLPAFRAVAETQHLPSASKRLHVSVSALSRTIGLLEHHVGQELFNRSGRSIVLNTAGAALLEAVRDAMTAVDRGLGGLRGDPFAGPLRISTLGVLTNHYVLPAVLSLKAKYPDLLPTLVIERTREANQLLLRGDLDVGFYYEALAEEGLDLVQLGVLTASVYCGRAHPLFSRRRPSTTEILDQEFSVPQVGDTGVAMDSWPPDLPRRVGMRIVLLATNLEVCRSGRLLTVLPDVAAHPYLLRKELRRLPLDVVPPTPIYAARRRTEVARGRVTSLIEEVRQEVRRVDEMLGGGRKR
jgi:DNA-binding transcriptional LysR family regulator